MEKTIVLEQLKDFKFAASYGGHEVILDIKEEDGGTDQGMTPGELLCTSLGACTAMNIVQYCKTINMPLEGLKVQATYISDQEDTKTVKFVLKIILPGKMKEREKALKRVADACYVKNTLCNPPEIKVEIESL